MAKFLKYVGIVVLFVGSLVVASIVWFDRHQQIDFDKHIPPVWVTCNGQVKPGSERYENLRLWLESNKSGWQNYFATAALGYFYSSDEITIYVYDSGVVISYQNVDSWVQVRKQADTGSINGTCQQSS